MSLFGKFSKASPKITAVKKVCKRGRIKSGIIFSLKNGLGKLYTISSEVEGDYEYNSKLMLGDTPLVQYIDPMCPTCTKLISAGYGIENTDCKELGQIRDAVNSDFVSVERSFDILAPLMGMLEDGYYLLADTECFPTDGGYTDVGGTFFWGTDPGRREYAASCNCFYIGEKDGCMLFCDESITPAYLYPTQSADRYDPERAEYYKSRITKENAPRAIAYNHLGSMSALLDGHHKAAAAALIGQAVKTLVIIPALYYPPLPGGKDRLVFSEGIELTHDELEEKAWQDILTLEEKRRNALRLCPKFDLTEPKVRTRQWESIFKGNCADYPSAEMLVLERCFGIDTDYEDMAGYLCAETAKGRSFRELFIEDRYGFAGRGERQTAIALGIKLLLTRAMYMGDMSLRAFALSAARHGEGYNLISTALRYLMTFREDEEVEQLCVDIISDPDLYKKYGDIVINYWEDEDSSNDVK